MSLAVSIDWARAGTYTAVGDDVSDRVRGGIACRYGRDQTTSLAPMVSGDGSFSLDNSSRDYSPRNTSSPLYGKLKPARPVLIQRTVSGTTYTIFAGHTNDQPINPDVATKTVALSLVDSLSDFRGQTLSTPLYSGVRTGDAIGHILDACGWTGGRDLDPGATFIPWWWAEGTDALTALQDLVDSEGSPALLTVGSSGEIVFRDRHHRLIRTASTTSQGTWRGSGAVEPVMNTPFTYDEAWQGVINSTSVSVDVRAPTDYAVVWSSTSTISLTDGETRLIAATSTDPFLMAVAPDPTVDMTVAFGVVSATLTRDSGAATTILLTASGGPAQVTSLQLRAIPVPVLYSTQAAAADGVSVADYGPRGYPAALNWGTPDNVQAILTTAVAQRAQPLPVLTVSFQVGTAGASAAVAPILARNLGDRVTIIEPETQTNGDFYIESITHQLTGEVDHLVTFGLEAAPAAQTNVLRFDVAGHGFDDGTFGTGLDDPATMFLFDSAVAGHRFDEGSFCS